MTIPATSISNKNNTRYDCDLMKIWWNLDIGVVSKLAAFGMTEFHWVDKAIIFGQQTS